MAASENVGPRDRAVVAGALGRMPRDLTGIAARCPFGYPAVTETAPIMSGGEPNPTLLYLTCPAMATVVSRAEAAGAVRTLRATCRDDDQLRGLMVAITRLYQDRRAALIAERKAPMKHDPRLGAGIGGPEGPETASCLHAYAAALLAVMSGWLAPRTGGLANLAREGWKRFLPSVEESWCHDNRCAFWDTAQRRAAIDVGTISVRLLVADLADGRPWTLARKAEVTRLGEGLRAGGTLDEAARTRTAEVVGRFAEEARCHGVDSIVLVGTSAAREAADGRAFIASLGRAHDLSAMVLSGIREAQLAYAGVALEIEGDPVVLDVGGGSTELIRLAESETVQAVSLELGASRTTERWIKSDPPTAEEMAAVLREAETAFAGLRRRFGARGSEPDEAAEGSDGAVLEAEPAARCEAAAGADAPKPGAPRLVGVAGTVTTLAALDAGLTEYDADVIHLRTLSLDSVRKLAARLGALTNAERAALPCVQAGRAPVIVGGALIVQAAMETLGYDELTVSERDLLDGLVLSGV